MVAPSRNGRRKDPGSLHLCVLGSERQGDLVCPPIYSFGFRGILTQKVRSADSYRVGLERLHSLFDSAPWLITSNSICRKTRFRSAALDLARHEFARLVPDICTVADFNSLGEEYRISDHCHLNWRGQEQAGILVADAIARILAR